jgi:phosphonate ABC transporter permease subunit PhnE
MTTNATPAPSRSRAALRRLIIVVIAAVVLVIFSYGWTITDIDFSVPQQPQRQQNVGNALRELLSPNVFTQDYTVDNTTTPFLINCPADFTSPAEPTNDGSTPYIVVTPACGAANEVVTVQGYNFAPDGLARVNWIAEDGDRLIRQVVGSRDDNFVANADGTFSVQIEVPRIRGSAGEMHNVEVQGRFPEGSVRFSDTVAIVLEKMIETIFLALIATVISIPPSVVLSFFAAHNLMRSVRVPLGNLLIMIVLLPIGYVIGAALLGRLGLFVLGIPTGDFGSAAAGVTTLGIAAVATTRRGRVTVEPPNIVRSILNVLLIALVTVVVVGLLGGLALLFQRIAPDGILTYVGTFVGALGQLVELLIVPIGGLVGAFSLSSIGGTLTRDALKGMSLSLSHVLGGVLGVLSGAVVLGVTALVGSAAAWLGLIPVLAAAALASPLLPMLYRRYVAGGRLLSPTDHAVLRVLSLIGAAAVGVFTFMLLNVGRSLIEGSVPPNTPALTLGDFVITQYMLRAMAIGAVLGGVSGALAGTRANFPIGEVVYTLTRTILNGLRSIEPLIMGIVFVIWVGIGPFAGVLALALHSIASLGKLYSEQIESIDSGPIEALESTGANRLQTIMYAVVPQIVPPYISFTMYRWDINVRMSTIIGFVGGGGVGFLLQQQINLLRYRDAGVAVLAIAIVVSVLDYASAAIRERYT